MRRVMMKSKIHRVTVTEANLDYEGSLTIDEELLEAADILPNEQVHVWDVTNGNRLVTYALVGKRGSGIVCVNGAGAHLIKPGDLVIVATYASMKDKDARRYKPLVVFVDTDNRLKKLPKPERD
ncbi:MAG TPA: aspartate 1-decarboxylase [Gemmata sp.]|jgi:aspartate 1-decarboxylase|nr:aspartate 1-decarboxylase [Gemmata sp.]